MPIDPPTTEAESAWQSSYDAEVQSAMADALKDLVPAEPAADEMAAAVDTVVAEADAKDAGDSAKSDGDGSPDQENSPEQEKPAEEQKTEEDKSATTALLKLLEKDKELVDVKSQLKAEREAFEAEKAAWQEQRSKEDVIGADALKRVLLTDPSRLFEALGIPGSKVSQLLIAKQLGDKAPEELKRATAEAQRDAEIQALRDELQSYKVSASARQYAEEVRGGVREYVTKGVSADCPTVAAVHKVDAARVENEIFQEIVSDAAARAAREPNGKPLSYEAAAARVEKRWAAVAAAFKSQAQTTSANEPKAGAPSAPNAAPKPGTPAVTPSKLTPQKPNPRPWQDPEWTSIVERELAEAVSQLKR